MSLHNLRDLLQQGEVDTKPKRAMPKPIFNSILFDLESKTSLLKRGIAPTDADVLRRQGLSPREIDELICHGKMQEFIGYCRSEDEREALANETPPIR